MKRFKTNILIRNNRLEMMQQNGLTVNYEILSDENYILELKKKLTEEAFEVSSAKNLTELKSELIDVMEVVEHIIDFYHIDKNELNHLKIQKQTSIGKFDKKIKTNYVEMPENHSEIKYYLSKPEKYPIIKF